MIINLNIGGKNFSTLKSTLEKCPNLLLMHINGALSSIYDKNGSIFIDRNPENFDLILDYLRSECKSDFQLPKLSDDSLKALLNDAEFFQISCLQSLIHRQLISKVLDTNEFKTLNTLCDFNENQRWKLIYRASKDGFESLDFHAKCDTYCNTLVLIKTTSGCIFGGFASESWDSNGHASFFKQDLNAFLFSFKNNLNRQEKFLIKNPEYAMNCGRTYGPSFGFDLIKIENHSNFNSLSSVSNKLIFMTGIKEFCVEEIEVFTKI
jgi:hypothetical protein